MKVRFSTQIGSDRKQIHCWPDRDPDIDIMNEWNVSRDTVKKWADTQEYRHHYNTKPRESVSKHPAGG